MTMPQGSTGLEPGGWMREWVSQDTLSGLRDRTRGQVEDYYLKGLELNSSWEFAQSSLFDGLMGGFKSLTEFIEKLAAVMSGAVEGTLEDIGKFFTELVNNIADIANEIADFFEKVDAAILDALKKLAEALGLGSDFSNITTVIGGIATFINSISDRVQEVVFEAIGKLADALGLGDVWDSIEDAISGIGDYVTGIFTQTNTFGELIDKINDSITEILDALAEKLGLDKWQNFLNEILAALGINLSGGENGTTSLTAAEVEALAATTVANQTLIHQLQAQLTAMGTPQGVSGGDEFEIAQVIDSAADWSSVGWVESLSGDGRMVIKDGHQAEWASGSNFLPDDKDIARYFRSAAADGNTKTAYQKISRVTGTKVAQNFLLAETNDLVLGRVSADRKKFVELRANRNGVSLHLVDGASVQELESARCPGPSVGVSYTLECGTRDGLRVFRVLRNTAVVLVHADTAGKTAALDANTGWGFGGISQGNLKPSSLHSVAVADNVPKT